MSTRKRATPGGASSNSVLFVFGALLIFRIANALTIRTFFQPDEYFQSLEPAWQIVFGPNSGAWITWEWKERLRSSLHPMLFAMVYRTADQLSRLIQASPRHQAEILIVAPKLLQACIAALGDFFTWRLASKIYGPKHAAIKCALALTVFSPWQWFCSVRTLSNSLETTLTVFALCYWPWQWLVEPARPGKLRETAPGGLNVSLVAAAIACILRPTNIIIWATITITLLVQHESFHKAVLLAQSAIICGSAVLIVLIGVDRSYYKTWTFPPLKFLYFNVVQSLSVFYGRNRPDYYLTEGLPLLLTTALPFVVVGMWQALRQSYGGPSIGGHQERHSKFVLALAVCVTVFAMTLISHKEVRFIYPLLPILHVLAAQPVAVFFTPLPKPRTKPRLALLASILVINVVIAAYVSLVHQRGVIDVLHYLRHEREEGHLPSPYDPANPMTVGFLMPCHSTPWRSHLVHPEIHAWALTCEPPLHISVEDRESYQDEADVFYANPAAWVGVNMQDPQAGPGDTALERAPQGHGNDRRDWPEYLVFFRHLESTLREVLARSEYRECWRAFNTHWHDDRRREGDVVVWCMSR